MNRPRAVWRLRIGWSAVWGIACVLLVALWGRSSRSVDTLYGRVPFSGSFSIESVQGWLILQHRPRHQSWGSGSQSVASYQRRGEAISDFETTLQGPRFAANAKADRTILALPTWSLAASMLVLAAFPWLPPSFSLRALLTVMTLVACLLGLIALSRPAGQ